ncbi:MAG: putative lipid II flippase FtsW [Streptosporangiaceae bacterium]
MVSEVSAEASHPAAGGAEGRSSAGSWNETTRGRLSARLAFLDRPLTSFYLVLGITTLLLALGLVMVLSTSSATGLMAGSSPWSGLQHQLFGVLIGLPCMWVAARCSPRRFRAAAYPLMFVSLLGLVVVLIVPPPAYAGGAARWIQLGGVQFQPSELAKFAFLLWGADLLARKEKLSQLDDWRQLLIPLLPGVALMALLVMMGDDLGTTFVLLIIFLALLWIIGTPGRLMLGMLAMIGLVLLMIVVVEPWRLRRLTGFLNPGGSPVGTNQQSIQGKWAVGSGGWFGVGLGASREKWGWVPESTTDFIFAILGEELGLIGTLCVTFLYGGLAYAGLRIARRVQDTFMRLAAGGATAWIVVQAVVNMGAVLGLLPITLVPLPLISEGLSSLLVTMVALGMLMSFAKREPGAAQALTEAGPGVPLRVLSWLGLAGRREKPAAPGRRR